MTLQVRAVNLDREHDELLGVLERNLPELSHARRFKWLYREGHLGPAWSWLLCDSGSREPAFAHNSHIANHQCPRCSIRLQHAV